MSSSSLSFLNLEACDDRESNVFAAKLSEQAERYDEMAGYMKAVAMHEMDLSVEERNLLSVAFKNAVGARRSSWRIMSAVEGRDRARGNTDNAARAEAYRKRIEAELHVICNTILEIVQKYLIPNCCSAESRVFYHKMRGDYHRYIAEFSDGEAREKASTDAAAAYQEASDISDCELAALNYSVFFYEVLADPDRACAMAQSAFERAVAQLDTVDEESYKDSTLIMQLLRDNLTLWMTDPQDGNQDADDAEAQDEAEQEE